MWGARGSLRMGARGGHGGGAAAASGGAEKNLIDTSTSTPPTSQSDRDVNEALRVRFVRVLNDPPEESSSELEREGTSIKRVILV
jgi:hypothetical protein